MLNSKSLGSKSAAANIGLSLLRRSWGVACVRPGVWHRKCSWSAVSVKWVSAWKKKRVLRITTKRHSSTTLGTTSSESLGTQTNMYVKQTEYFAYFLQFLVYSWTKNYYCFLEHTQKYLRFISQKMLFKLYLIFFGSRNINVLCKPCAKI